MALFSSCRFSRRGFTHVFMFLVLGGYTALGALLFIALEAPYEEEEKQDIVAERTQLIEALWEHHVQNKGLNFSRWEGVSEQMKPQLLLLLESSSRHFNYFDSI